MPKIILLIISTGSLLCCCFGCYTNKSSVDISRLPVIDTFYAAVFIDWEPAKETVFSDSLTQLYLRKAHQSNHRLEFDTTYFEYTAIDLGAYRLSETSYGQIVRFQPNRNGYYSVQLFVLNHKNLITEVLELAYLFGEESVQAEASSYLVQENEELTIYNKQDWANSYGRDINIVLDTVLAYKIPQYKTVALPLSEKKQQDLRKLFQTYREASKKQ